MGSVWLKFANFPIFGKMTNAMVELLEQDKILFLLKKSKTKKAFTFSKSIDCIESFAKQSKEKRLGQNAKCNNRVTRRPKTKRGFEKYQEC